jgi:hypothetical protein
MSLRRLILFFLAGLLLSSVILSQAQSSSSPSSSSSSKRAGKPASGADSPLDAGTVDAGGYRNKGLGLSCRIPAGWVLRTEEMNAREEDESAAPTKDAETMPANSGSAAPTNPGRAGLDRTAEGGCPHTGCGKVLLAAFSRPPEATGEDVNSSILIAAESVSAYPGLKEAAQYFGPLTEVAKARGLAVVNEPYEFSVGTKTMVRADFQKNVGSRVMRQSTVVWLARGEAVSLTFIGGTQDEVEEFIAGVSFGVGGKAGK